MRGGPRGSFSLVELAIVIAVIGVLVTIAVPRYAKFVTRHCVATASQRIMADLAFAQRQARLSGASQTVRFKVSLDEYRLVDVPDPDRSGADYVVRLGAEPYQVSIASVDFGGSAEVTFDIHGTPDRGGSVVVQGGRWVRQITVDPVTGGTTVAEVAVGGD